MTDPNEDPRITQVRAALQVYVNRSGCYTAEQALVAVALALELDPAPLQAMNSATDDAVIFNNPDAMPADAYVLPPRFPRREVTP